MRATGLVLGIARIALLAADNLTGLIQREVGGVRQPVLNIGAGQLAKAIEREGGVVIVIKRRGVAHSGRAGRDGVVRGMLNPALNRARARGHETQSVAFENSAVPGLGHYIRGLGENSPSQV